MTTVPLSRRRLRARVPPSGLVPAERSALATVAVALALLAVAILAWTLDDRTLQGVSVWSKPMKFNLSFALHLATLLLLLQVASAPARAGRVMAVTLLAASTATLVELLYVMLQAARGRESHFNVETPWETFLYYGVMGGAAVVLVLATLAVGVAVVLAPRPDIGPGLRWGAAAGLLAGGAATFLVAGAMASGQVTDTGRWVGGSLSGADGLPLFGWSTTGGDLRVPHFAATHLVQALPLLGWLADRLRWPRPGLWVLGGTVLGLIVVRLLFLQAAAGQPLLPPAWGAALAALG